MVNKNWTGAYGEVGTLAKSADDLLSLKVKEKARKEIDRQEEIDEAKHETEMAELEKKKRESQVKTDSAGGVQITGRYDIFEEKRRSEEMVGQALAKADEDKKKLEERLVSTEKALADQKYETLVKQMETMNKDLMEKLSKFAEGANNKDDITSLFSKIETLEPILTKLGYAKASASGSSDLATQIALKKMDIDNSRAEREFKWKLLQDEREYNRSVRRDDREMSLKERESADKKEAAIANRGMLTDGIESFGRAVGAGLRDAGASGETGEPIEKRPAGAGRQQRPQQPPPQGQQQPPGEKNYHIEAGVGDGGVFDCPDCDQPVTIGEDTVDAICANCGYHTPIIRTA